MKKYQEASNSESRHYSLEVEGLNPKKKKKFSSVHDYIAEPFALWRPKVKKKKEKKKVRLVEIRKSQTC